MRTCNVLAYDLFTSSPRVEFTKEAIEAYTEIKGAGGATAICRILRDECNLNIVTIKRDKQVSFLLDIAEDHVHVDPKCIVDHFARNRKSSRVSVAIVIDPQENVDRACMAPDYNVPVLMITHQPADGKVKRIRPSRAKKK